MNYEKDIQIDQDALDVEWLEQPKLMMRYARIEAEAEREYNEAKMNLDLVKAQIDKRVRTDPDRFGIAKITETAVTGAILMTDDYKNAHQALNEALFNWNVAKGAVRAFHQRKDALENLVRLHGQQYFAGPSVPRDLGKEWEAKQRQRNVDKAVKIKRRT